MQDLWKLWISVLGCWPWKFGLEMCAAGAPGANAFSVIARFLTEVQHESSECIQHKWKVIINRAYSMSHHRSVHYWETTRIFLNSLLKKALKNPPSLCSVSAHVAWASLNLRIQFPHPHPMPRVWKDLSSSGRKSGRIYDSLLLVLNFDTARFVSKVYLSTG